jgi:hypothetical protein
MGEILEYAPSLNARFGVVPLAASVILIAERGPVDRQQLLTRLEKAWREFQDSYAALSDSQMTKPGVTGEWPVRDILAHVTTWEQEALKHLPTILKGNKPPRYSVTHGGINGFNRIMTEQKRDLTLIEVRQDLENTHRRLTAYIDRVPEEQFRTETPFRHRLRLDTYSHYPKHAAAIRKWRNEQLSGRKES